MNYKIINFYILLLLPFFTVLCASEKPELIAVVYRTTEGKYVSKNPKDVLGRGICLRLTVDGRKTEALLIGFAFKGGLFLEAKKEDFPLVAWESEKTCALIMFPEYPDYNPVYAMRDRLGKSKKSGPVRFKGSKLPIIFEEE